MILYNRNTGDFSDIPENEYLGVFVMSATEKEFREAAEDLARLYGNNVVYYAGQVYTASQKSFMFHEQENVTEFEESKKVETKAHKEQTKRPVKERVMSFLKGAARIQSENSIVKDIVNMYFAGIPLTEIKKKTEFSLFTALPRYSSRNEQVQTVTSGRPMQTKPFILPQS